MKCGAVAWFVVQSSWNLMAHGHARERKWRGNWRMEWVAITLTLPRNTVYPALLPLMRTHRLPVVDGTDAPADLNGLVRFAERTNLVSARVPSHFKRSLASPRDLRGSRNGTARTVLRHVTPCRWARTSNVSSYRNALICKVLVVQEERADLPWRWRQYDPSKHR
jgi:hypothetical protein